MIAQEYKTNFFSVFKAHRELGLLSISMNRIAVFEDVFPVWKIFCKTVSHVRFNEFEGTHAGNTYLFHSVFSAN